MENQQRESESDISAHGRKSECDLQFGHWHVERGNNDERKFEVPSHQWFDLTDRSGAFGVTILSDSKYGSDKPDDKTLRLTLLRTPGIGPRAGYADQSTQDWGRHEFVYGLAAHGGDWRRGAD